MARRIVLLSLLAAALLAVWGTGLHTHLTPDRLREMAEELGPWAPVAFVAAFAVLHPLYVPGALFMLTAPLIWPLPVAFVLSLAGGTGAGVVGSVYARVVGREWVERHMPRRMRAWDARLATHGFRTVLLLRVFVFLFPPLHYAIGLSKVGLVPATLATAIGLIPGVAVLTLAGATLLQAFEHLPGWVLIPLFILGVTFAWAVTHFAAPRPVEDDAGAAPGKNSS